MRLQFACSPRRVVVLKILSSRYESVHPLRDYVRAWELAGVGRGILFREITEIAERLSLCHINERSCEF